jgi:hypothetical protein
MKNGIVWFGGCALVLAISACGTNGSDGSPAGPQASLSLTLGDSIAPVVVSAGRATLNDLDVLSSVETTIGFSVAPAQRAGLSASFASNSLSGGFAAASGCTLNTVTDVFTCAPTTNDGITLIRSFEFFDASGEPMTQFNDSTTASANVSTTEAGVRPSATGADTISGSRNMSATGLLGTNTTRTWNGTGSHTDGGYYTDSAATRTYDLSYASTFTNIVVTLPRSSNPWPTSGTITRQVNGTATVIKGSKTKSITISRSVTITFNGSEVASMTVGSTQYLLDLASGMATQK